MAADPISPHPSARSRSTAAAVNNETATSTADSADSAPWSYKWVAATSDVESDVGFDESANRLRSLVQTGLLRFTDLRDEPVSGLWVVDVVDSRTQTTR